MTASAPARRPWDAVPLDVDGEPTVAEHRAVCLDPAAYWICCADDEAPLPGGSGLNAKAPSAENRRGQEVG